MSFGNDAPKQLSDGNSQGTVLGINAQDKVALFGATAVPQPTASGNAHTVSAGSTTAAYTNTTFDGGIGTTGYTIGDIVAALKKLGAIAS